jgi:hypothetical protein
VGSGKKRSIQAYVVCLAIGADKEVHPLPIEKRHELPAEGKTKVASDRHLQTGLDANVLRHPGLPIHKGARISKE